MNETAKRSSLEERTAFRKDMSSDSSLGERKSWRERICGFIKKNFLPGNEASVDQKKGVFQEFSIANEAEWRELVRKLENTKLLDETFNHYPVLKNFASHFEIYKKRLSRFCQKAPEEYDEETAELIVPKLCNLLNDNFRQLLEACEMRGASPDHRELAKAVDRYFENIGIKKVIFNTNVPADSWHHMEGKIESVSKRTDDREKIGKIAGILVQPRAITYRNRFNELETYHFCGKAFIFSDISNT